MPVNNQELIEWHCITLMINMESFLTFMDYLLIDRQNILKISQTGKQLNGLNNTNNPQELFIDVCGHCCTIYIYNRCHNVKINTIVNMLRSKVREDNNASVRYFVERNVVVKEIVKPSSSFKLQSFKTLR